MRHLVAITKCHIVGIVIVFLLGLRVAPLPAESQHASKLPRVGLLVKHHREQAFNALMLGLRERGYVAGETMTIVYHCLSADCAVWSTRTALAFIDAFYEKLGIRSPLESHRADILGLLA